MSEALEALVDPRTHIATEMFDSDYQPLAGEALDRAHRAYHVYSRLLRLGPDVTLHDMFDFDMAFFMTFDRDEELVDEWEYSGRKDEAETEWEAGPQLRNMVILTTIDGYAAFLGEWLPEPLIALARDGQHPEIRFRPTPQ